VSTNNAVNNTLSGQTGTGSFVGSTSPSLTTPNIGAATATSLTFGGSTLSIYLQNQAFTPTFTFDTPGDLSVSYAVQVGSFNQIGNIVFFNYTIRMTPTFTTAAGTARFGGLPSAVSGNFRWVASISEATTFPAGCTSLTAAPVSGQTYMNLQGYGSGTALTPLTVAHITSGVQRTLVVSGFYVTP
jgi:hypothetical protein